MATIDFDTDRLITVCYPQYSGGKFLINCLALSHHCVLQDADLALQQLQGTLMPDDKLTILQQRLAKSKEDGVWNDLDFGCSQLFGVDAGDYAYQHPDMIKHMMDDVIDDLSHSDQYFFTVAHNTVAVDRLLHIWPNSRLIIFDNYRGFINQRRSVSSALTGTWQAVRDQSWPDEPPRDAHAFQQLPRSIQEDFRSHAPKVYKKYYQWPEVWDKIYRQEAERLMQQLGEDNCYVWDCEWYQDESQFNHHISDLYAWLGIGRPDLDQISVYRSQWLDTIDSIRTKKK